MVLPKLKILLVILLSLSSWVGQTYSDTPLESPLKISKFVGISLELVSEESENKKESFLKAPFQFSPFFGLGLGRFQNGEHLPIFSPQTISYHFMKFFGIVRDHGPPIYFA